MEGTAFDGLARRLAARVTRRGGLRGALAALGAGLAAWSGAEAERARTARGGPSTAGPCGPGRADNICRRDSDCCTGYCRKGRRRKIGNCRCVPPAAACKPGQKCCNGSVCFQGRCVRNQPSKICAVCARGCAHTSVNAAYAAAKPGDTLAIAAGTWPAGITVSKSIRLMACDGATGVRLVPDGTVTDGETPAIIVGNPADTSAYTVILEGLELAGSGKDNGESLIYTSEGGPVTFRILGCSVSDAWAGINLGPGNHVIQDSAFTRSYYGATISIDGSVLVSSSTFNGCDSYGFYATGFQEPADRPKSLISYEDCEFVGNMGTGLVQYGGTGVATGCTITGNGYSGASVTWGNLTLTDTVVSGNDNPNWGGGVSVDANFYTSQGYNASLTLTGTTSITGNTAPEASGIGVVTNGVLIATVTGASSANVFGNLNGEQCETSTDSANWSPVANCSF